MITIDNSKASAAYSMLLMHLRNNDIRAIQCVGTINNLEISEHLYNQISDTLIIMAKEIQKDQFDLFCQIIDDLNCISNKDSYLLTAEVFLLDVNNINAAINTIEKVLSNELLFQGTSFKMDIFNEILIFSIYIKDENLLERVISRIKAMEDNNA